MAPRYLIRGGDIVTPSGIRKGAVLIENGVLKRVGRVARSEARRAETIEATGRFVLPGLIDLHVQGAGGSDLPDHDPQAVRKICRSLAAYGTTAFLATTVIDTTARAQPHIRRIVRSIERRPPGARILGIHLEGPFISPDKKGMIQDRFIRPPSRDYYERVRKLCAGHLRMMTIAPELPGALDLIADLAGDGTIASLGHTNATYEETVAGIQAGLSHVTHVGNAMRSLHHREPGALGAVLMSDSLTMQLIADGVHLHPEFVAWLIRLKGPSRFALITDGLGAMGLPPGRYRYGSLDYVVENGTARYVDGTLIGTALTQLQLVRRARDFAALPLHEAVNMASLYPARILGAADRKGSLEAGKDGDLLVCDRELNVETVFVDGERSDV